MRPEGLGSRKALPGSSMSGWGENSQPQDPEHLPGSPRRAEKCPAYRESQFGRLSTASPPPCPVTTLKVT